MTGTTTGQLALATATDSDDVRNYGTVTLPTVLQEMDDLFHSSTGHSHNGSGEGAPIGSGGYAAGSIPATALAAGVSSTIKTKAADESVTSSTTLQDDNDLTFTVGADETWIFEGLLVVAGADTGDIKIAIACSGATALAWSAVGPIATLAAGTATGDGQFIAETTLGQARAFGCASSAVPIGIQIRGLVTGGGSPATCALQWAQQTSDATATTVKAGSHIVVRQVV